MPGLSRRVFQASLTGLGGRGVIVPLLTLVFGIVFRYAIGASLISVIATSSGAAAAYVREGRSKVRIGLFLEIAVIFGLVPLCSAISASGHDHPQPPAAAAGSKTLGDRLRLNGRFPAQECPRPYRERRVPLGFGLIACAGIRSGLLGIGSGAVKVLAIDVAMGLPFKV